MEWEQVKIVMWCVRRRNWILFWFTFPLTVFELQFLCSVAHKSSSSSSRTTTPTSTPASPSSSWAKVNTTNRERESDNNITHRRESGSGPGEWKRENGWSKLKAQRADSLIYKMAAVRGHQYFSLRWNNYQNTMTSVFQQLREDLSFVDVTLSCEHGSLKAHKVSANSLAIYWIVNWIWFSLLLLLGCSLCLLNVFPKAAAWEPVQTSNNHPARRHYLHRP